MPLRAASIFWLAYKYKCRDVYTFKLFLIMTNEHVRTANMLPADSLVSDIRRILQNDHRSCAAVVRGQLEAKHVKRDRILLLMETYPLQAGPLYTAYKDLALAVEWQDLRIVPLKGTEWVCIVGHKRREVSLWYLSNQDQGGGRAGGIAGVNGVPEEE